MGHVVFDFDGTLINSMEYAYDAVQGYLHEKLRLPISREAFEAAFAAHHEKTYHLLGIDTPHHRNEMWNHWMDYELNNRVKYCLFPGIGPMLKHLQASGHHLYLWTARDRASTLDLLRQFSMIDWFQDIRCGDDCAKKPDPTGIEQMLPAVNKEEVIMVGDSTMDIEGGVNFGVYSIGAVWSRVTNRDSLLKSGAHVIAEHPDSCLEFILAQFR